MTQQAYGFAPLEARTREPIALAMQRLWLTGEVTPAGARLSVQHVFRSEEKSPLEVIYAFPLARDAALHRFRIAGDGFEAHSELKPVEEAAKCYEKSIMAGSLAALAQIYGDGIVNLTVGNIRPGETVTVHLELVAGVELNDEGFRFRFPFTLAPRYHSRARYFRAAGGDGEIELPVDEFGSVILPPIREDAGGLHEVGFDLTLSGVAGDSDVGSPSHPISLRREEGGRRRVALGVGSDHPDRDLVLDCGFSSSVPRVLAAESSPGNLRFAVVVPSECFGHAEGEPRRVVFLLDRSGSMQGAPIEQARKAILACLAVLSEDDKFGIVAFDDGTEVLDRSLLKGTTRNRQRAAAFLKGIEPRGGTEVAQAIEAAAKMIAGDGSDIVLFTDGQVAGTEQVLSQARATGARVHTLGIGSAAQDRFLGQLARDTGGASRCVNPDERVDIEAVNLFASVRKPVATGLKTNPAVRPEVSQTVTPGVPALLLGETSEPSLLLDWEGGSLAIPIKTSEPIAAETLRLLQGARLIADWESRYESSDALAPLKSRQQNRVAMRLRQLSEEYGLASREMALVAVVTRKGDNADDIPTTRVVPVGKPRGVDMSPYFDSVASMRQFSAPGRIGAAQCFGAAPALPSQPPAEFSMLSAAEPSAMRAAGRISDTDELVALASRLEPDGGMPGNDAAVRVARSAIALLAFLAHGHNERAGTFRMHVRRLVKYLHAVSGLNPVQTRLLQNIFEAAGRHRRGGPDWLDLALNPTPDPWKELASVFEFV